MWVHTYHLPYFADHAKGELLPWQSTFNESLVNDARHADVRISVARWQQEFLRREHSIDSIVIPNGVDIAACDSGSGERFLTQHGLDNFVLYVGRNDPVKNPVDFVRLAQRMEGVAFVMIGRDLSAEALIKEWEIEPPPNLIVMDELDHRSVQDAIAASSAVVVTSKREGLPTLVLEALAHGKPMVVPDELGCVEASNNGEYALIYKQGDIEQLVEQTKAALGGQATVPGARNYVLANYDWRVVAQDLDLVYSGQF